jgi:pullulanase/glycogen debranching enzyme
MDIYPGQPYPLGAVYDGSGTNFSLFSEIAERVELCLFDEEGREAHIALPEVTGYCWHGYLPTGEPGQRYCFRVHGPWDPANGHRCNPAKLLLDPYAKAIQGQVEWDEAVFPYRFHDGPEASSNSDSAPFMPRCVVHQPYFDWSGDRRRGWFQGRPIHGGEVKDIAWFTMEGDPMAEEDWGQGYAKSLGIFLNGAAIPNPNPRGEPVTDDSFSIIFNAHHEPLDFCLPGSDWGTLWVKELDTETGWVEKEESFKAGDQISVKAHSLIVLRHGS